MNRKKLGALYFLYDFVSASSAWFLLFIFRKIYIEPAKYGHKVDLFFDQKLILGLVLIPLFWTFLYYILGYYVDSYKKSRLKELLFTLSISVLGSILLFFILLIDDEIGSYQDYYQLIFFYITVHFVLTFIPRIIQTHITVRKIHSKQIGFPTLIIGSSDKALHAYLDIENSLKSSGFKFVGFVGMSTCDDSLLNKHLPCLGVFKNIQPIIRQHHIEDVILALESNEHDKIQQVLKFLKPLNISIKIIPDFYDLLSGQVKMNSILGVPLMEINQETMPLWQRMIKRVMDVSISLFIMIVFSWFFLALAIIIRMTSKGPVFYSHERLGKNGVPFKIYKFRSMVVNAEEDIPMLSSDEDTRITPIGRFLRQTRLDEIPQFYNVLMGDMSLVGPRPERQYFVDQIMSIAPHYAYLHKVRPGITSWGQVKFGYAQNVAEMVERLKYDVLYMENRSLLIDVKILIYTVLIVLQKKGK